MIGGRPSDPQRFKDIKSGKVYSMRRISGIMVVLETDDGLNRVWTSQEDLKDSFEKLTPNDPQEK